MPPLDAPSPTFAAGTNNPLTTNPKRPRPSAATASTAGPSRVKRRKAEDTAGDDEGAGGKGRQGAGFGVGMVKGREEEWGEPSDVQTKIDFNSLPDETLYKYLEYHDLLPRWTTSPWSEDPCTPPNALYSLPSHVVNNTATADIQDAPTESSQDIPAVLPTEPATSQQPVATSTGETPSVLAAIGEPTAKPDDMDNPTKAEDDEDDDEEEVIAPTTRSKTAPFRKAPTPPPASPSPPPDVKRGVITLSDVAAARAVLAEKANAHWVKGLGGGQNKESETIVNFLYKMKAGPGKLLRVYNPYPPPSSY